MAIDLTDRLDEETKKAQSVVFNPGAKNPFGPVAPTLGSGLSGMTRTIAESGVGPAPAPTPATAPAPVADAATNSHDGKALNEILARENKARGEMVAMAPTGFATPSAPLMPGQLLPGEVAPGVTRQDLENASRGSNSARELGAIKMMMDANKQQGDIGVAISGQAVNAQRAAGHDQVLMRGQDINAANEAVRAGIDAKRLGILESDSKRAGEKWGIERKTMEGAQADSNMVRSARAELIAAQQSGDPAKIAAAKDKAIAAGIKFDKPTQEFSYVANPLGGGVIVNKDTGAASMFAQDGKKTADIPAAGPQTPASEYQAAIAAAKGDPKKIAAINERARQAGVIR